MSLHSGTAANIWRIDDNGGNLTQITHGTLDQSPSCSPDGKWVVYSSSDGGKFTIWRIAAEGGAPQQLTDANSYSPTISPDGASVAFFYGEGTGVTFRLRVAVIPAAGGSFLHTFDVLPQVSGKLRFTPDGQALAYAVTDGRGVGNVWAQTLTGGAPTQITDFKSDQIFDFAWSRDGKQLAVSRGKTDRDVVLLTETSH